MTSDELDRAVLASALRLAAERGWRDVTVAAAAREAGLPLADVNDRARTRLALLPLLGRVLDRAALSDGAADGPVRDRLFDVLMRRFDALQPYRDGVLALMRALPADPCAALVLACDTRRSMQWMLEAAGIDASGLTGAVRVKGLLAVWLFGLRAWRTDESSDLSATMVAVDTALARADRAAAWLNRLSGRSAQADDPLSDEGAPSDEAPPSTESLGEVENPG